MDASTLMADPTLMTWLVLGVVLVMGEFVLPGLISIFVGMGALTVALLLHLGEISGIPAQMMAWFVSSLIYIFSIRFLVIKYYPTDEVTKNIDEDEATIGLRVAVVEAIPESGIGRVAHSGSTWPAETTNGEALVVGNYVTIVGRDNITFLVEKQAEAENPTVEISVERD